MKSLMLMCPFGEIYFKNENKLCEIILNISDYYLMASDQCKIFEEAISETSETLESQIEKRKTKQLNTM